MIKSGEHQRRMQMDPAASESSGLVTPVKRGIDFVLPTVSGTHTPQTYDRFIPSRSAADSGNPYRETDRLISVPDSDKVCKLRDNGLMCELNSMLCMHANESPPPPLNF